MALHCAATAALSVLGASGTQWMRSEARQGPLVGRVSASRVTGPDAGNTALHASATTPQAKVQGLACRDCGGIGTGPMLSVQPAHQHGLAMLKLVMACHLGGALLSGETVSMNDSRAPHSP